VRSERDLLPLSRDFTRRIYRYEQLKVKKAIRSDMLFAGFGDTRWEKRNSTTSLYLLQGKLGLVLRYEHLFERVAPAGVGSIGA
jgi:hypothetical protein